MLLLFWQNCLPLLLICAAWRVSHMSERYTESELRLLAQYKALREIKEGKRELNAPPSAAPADKSAQQLKVEPSGTQTSSGQKLPSKIRLKQSRQASSAEPGSPQGPSSPAPQPSSLPSAAVAAATTSAAPEKPAVDQPFIKATISRSELAAALAKRRQQQSLGTADPLLQKLAAQSSASEAAAGAASTAAEQAPKQAFKAPGRPQAKAPSPRPAVAVAGPPVTMTEQPSVRAPAAANNDEIDFGAVSSPEYEVNYDAVSSPEYDVSDEQKQQQEWQKQHVQVQLQALDDQPQPLATPERQHGLKSSSSSRTPPSATVAAAAVAGQKPPLPSRDPTAAKAQTLRPNSSDGPAARRGSRSPSRSHSGSRSPDHRRPGSRSCSRQADPQHQPRGSSGGGRRSRSYMCTRSRSRSPSACRDRDDGSSKGYRKSRSLGQRSRSQDRSRDAPKPHRRRSPDYSVGARKAGSRSPSKEGARTRGGDSSSDSEQQQRHHRASGEWRGSSRQNSKPPRPTLFVGDLPPAGFSSEDLHGLFSAYGWSIANARVMGSQCYGFVEFEHQYDAEEALQLVSDGHPNFAINGQSIRASWARGSMPDWKRGKAVVSRMDPARGLAGLEAYEHPTARMLRLQAAAATAQTLVGLLAVEHVEPEEGQLPVAVAAPVPPRALIDYGDL